MMYLSHLLIDVGSNPDRPRPGRLWLRNMYRVHQRICMAFPSASRKSGDADFLQPFKPKEFGDGQVHVERATESGFLFRIDPHTDARAVILVQSAIEPDWDYAFHNAHYFLAAPPEMKQFDPRVKKGERLRFRLLANPTRRLSRNSPDAKEESIGKRVPVPPTQLFEWLARKGESGGFSIQKESTTVQPAYDYFRKPDKEHEEKSGDEGRDQKSCLRSVRFDGVLEVTDGSCFRNTLVRGIGPAKAFGFGLLSIAPVK